MTRPLAPLAPLAALALLVCGSPPDRLSGDCCAATIDDTAAAPDARIAAKL